MNWPGFMAAKGAWLFLLLIPLIIFYFLKLKRPRLELPSLALWRSVMNDQRVNSPFQKFKRNLLLLLQLLLLICLCLAAMQPYWPSGADQAAYLPILIDTSASMGALDAAGGTTRLDAAKEEVRKLIDNLLPEQRLSLIAVSNTARQLTDFTDNKRVLRDALAQLQVSQVSSRLEDGLRMTQALARTVKIDTVVLYTDGNVPPEIDFELPFQLNYQKLAPAGQNMGITALNARRMGERWDVFVRVEGGQIAKDAKMSATVELRQDGKLTATDALSLEGGQSQRVVFPVTASGAAALEIKLKPDGFDSLAADNVGYLDLPVVRPLAVFCPPSLESYRRALKGLDETKEVLLYPDENGENKAASFDLVISDRKEDLTLETGAAVFTGIVPDDLNKLVTTESGAAEVIDWQRSSPLLQHVLLTDLQIADKPVKAAGAEDRDFEEVGYEVLAQGAAGPLIVRKESGGKPFYFLLFHTDRSTLPYRLGFPIMVANALQIAMQQAGLSESRGNGTGNLPPLTLKPETGYDVAGPDGSRVEAKTNADGLLIGVGAPEVGRYVIREGSRDAASVGVSLLAARETGLGGIDRLQFKELSVTASDAMLKSDRPLWPLLAGVGFAFLLVEWWLFQRRPLGT